MITEIRPGKQNIGLPFSERTLGEPLPPYQSRSEFKEGDRISFPYKDSLMLGRITRRMTKELPMAVLADERMRKYNEQEASYWCGNNPEKVEWEERVCYFYSTKNVLPVEDDR